MMMLALTILAAMAPVFLMMWFDDIEARHEREHENNRNRRPSHDNKVRNLHASRVRKSVAQRLSFMVLKMGG